MHFATPLKGGRKSSEADAHCSNDSAPETRESDACAALDGRKRRHDHWSDLGFGSFSAYFFCMVASVFVRSNGFGAAVPDESIVLAFLSFVGATAFSLLFLAMVEQYMIRHDNQRQFSLASCVLLMLGPVANVVELVMGVPNALVLFLAFSLSGCGYAMCLLVWGRILSVKDERSSSRQVLADVCAAVVVMVAVSALSPVISSLVCLCLGALAGLIGSVRFVSSEEICGEAEQIVVSDTRDTIPKSSYFVGGTLWMVFGVFLALLRWSPVFDGHMSVAVVAVLLVAAVAGVAIARLHRNWEVGFAKLSWAPVPLLVMGLAFFIVGGQQMLRLALVFILLSMVISYLYFMMHFSALSHRPDLLPDQMFSWGWLAPFVGIFAGVFVGIVCTLVGDAVAKYFLPVLGGVLVITLIVSMHSIEKIALKKKEQEVEQRARVDDVGKFKAQMFEVFSDIGLTEREKDVAFLLMRGHSQAAIAGQLYVAASTVNTHVKHIYRKAMVSSKQEFIDLCQSLHQRKT